MLSTQNSILDSVGDVGGRDGTFMII
jgi:hypothetical protein